MTDNDKTHEADCAISVNSRHGCSCDNDKASESKVRIGFNEWFCSLPEGRQAILREDKWMLASTSYDAGIESQQAEIDRLKEENKMLDELNDQYAVVVCGNDEEKLRALQIRDEKITQLEHQLAEARKEQWISVDSSLPAEGRRVLCYEDNREGGSIFVAWRHKFNANKKQEFIAWMTPMREEFWPNPTHWMPFPSVSDLLNSAQRGGNG